jgi:hypothetical protein
MRSADFEAPFRGLDLPRVVVDKIYRKNAQALFPHAWHIESSTVSDTASRR